MSWKQLRSHPRDGVVVSFERDDGERLTITRRATDKTEALQEAVDAVLGFDDRYRVVAISTPQTIFTDLVGRMPHPRGGWIECPEVAMLRTARRFYALHPRLMDRSIHPIATSAPVSGKRGQAPRRRSQSPFADVHR